MAHILLLEDTKDMRDAIRASLVMNEHDVVVGRDGNEGVAYLNSEDPLPDIIITDLKMPEMDGIALTRYVRQQPDWKHLAIIVTSGVPGDQVNALEAGADAFIVKPFKHSDLEALIHKLTS